MHELKLLFKVTTFSDDKVLYHHTKG